MGVQLRTKVQADRLYDLINSTENKYTSSKEVSEKLGMSLGAVSRAAAYAKEAHPDLKCKPGCGYFIEDEKTNHEGYPDPTAATALANVMMSNGIKSEPYMPKTIIYDELFKPGVVFQTLLGRSYVRMYVASVSGPFLYTFALNEKGDGINPTRLFSIDARKASVEGEVTNGTEIMSAAARKAVLDLFGFTMSEEEKRNRDLEFKYELLKQRADIYEKCFYAVCGKGAQ